MKIQALDLGKIFEKYLSDKGYVSIFTKNSQQQKTIQFKNSLPKM